MSIEINEKYISANQASERVRQFERVSSIGGKQMKNYRALKKFHHPTAS